MSPKLVRRRAVPAGIVSQIDVTLPCRSAAYERHTLYSVYYAGVRLGGYLALSSAGAIARARYEHSSPSTAFLDPSKWGLNDLPF